MKIPQRMTRPIRNNVPPPSNGQHTLCRHCLAIFALRLSSQARSVVTSKPSIGRDAIPYRYIDTAHCRNIFDIHTKFSSNSSYHSLSIKKNSRLHVYQYGPIYFHFSDEWKLWNTAWSYQWHQKRTLQWAVKHYTEIRMNVRKTVIQSKAKYDVQSFSYQMPVHP